MSWTESPARASTFISTSTTACAIRFPRPCGLLRIGPSIRTSTRHGTLKKARAFDLVFAAQRDGAESLRRAGIGSAAWLPLACDPEIHGRHEVAKQYDVAFVGNVFPGPRAELLNLIRRKYPASFIGQCYFEDMARAYSSARTVFNRSIKNDVNMRVFEALASGSLLVTNDLSENGQAELFRDGVHLATYREAEDLLDKLAFYLGARRYERRSRRPVAPRFWRSTLIAIGWSGCCRWRRRRSPVPPSLRARRAFPAPNVAISWSPACQRRERRRSRRRMFPAPDGAAS